MPYCRRYETFEVRQLLQQAEGANSALTGQGAHSRGLHALRTPGGTGVTTADMMHRTHKQPGESNSQFNNRGGAVQTSTFPNLIQQAEAATQALNSAKGQAGLAILDNPLHAAKSVRLTLEITGIRETAFGLGAATPGMATVHKTHAAVSRPGGGGAGVMVIIDRGPGAANIHIQTCYPLSVVVGGGSFKAVDWGTKAVIATG